MMTNMKYKYENLYLENVLYVLVPDELNRVAAKGGRVIEVWRNSHGRIEQALIEYEVHEKTINTRPR